MGVLRPRHRVRKHHFDQGAGMHFRVAKTDIRPLPLPDLWNPKWSKLKFRPGWFLT
jgi:hypothetical protein